MTDLFAAFVWNPGSRRLTRPIKSGVWWREPDDGGKRTAWEIILGHSAAKYSSSASLRRLFKAMQQHIINGVLPYQKMDVVYTKHLLMSLDSGSGAMIVLAGTFYHNFKS